MAYGNWGAFVYKNGERMPKWEDNTPFRELELENGYWQAFQSGDDGIDAYHAILGEGRVRLCGYKNDPTIFIDNLLHHIDLGPYLVRELDVDCEWNGEGIEGLPGYYFKAQQYCGNMIDLELREPDGTTWTATCGYNYGAGHMEE